MHSTLHIQAQHLTMINTRGSLSLSRSFRLLLLALSAEIAPARDACNIVGGGYLNWFVEPPAVSCFSALRILIFKFFDGSDLWMKLEAVHGVEIACCFGGE